jgi:DNA-binding transcriptional MerR regulator
MTVSLPPKLYFRIGEVAGLVGVEPHVLRYWEREFRSIRPTKSAKGQRVYSRKDVEALIVVKDLLYAQGFTIAGAKKRLQRTPEPARASAPLASPAQHEDVGLLEEVLPAPAPQASPQASPPASLGRHAEEALLRTLDRHAPSAQQPQMYAPATQVHASATQGHALAPQHAPAPQHAHAPLQPQPQTSRSNGGRREASAMEATRKTLISLRAEVEALLSELGG